MLKTVTFGTTSKLFSRVLFINSVKNFVKKKAKRKQRHQNGLLSTLSASLKPFEEIPGLSTLPLIGPLHHFLPLVGTIGPKTNFLELLKILHEKFGDVVKMEGIFARADMVILYKPEDYDQIYRSEDILPSRPGFETIVYYRTQMRKSIYDGVYGLTSAQGLQWRDFRTKVNPALLKPKLVKLYARGLDEIAQEMIARLVRLKDDGNYLANNFDLEMTKYSLESVGLISLGTRLGCLKDDLGPDQPARQLMKCAKDTIDLAFKLELGQSIWKFFLKFGLETPNFKKLMNTFDLQWEISKKFIDDAQQKIIERKYDIAEEDKSIIEKLLAIDEKVAVMMANEMLFAGIDTVLKSSIIIST